MLNVRVEGPLVVNTGSMTLKAALAGFGLAHLPEERVRADIAAGQLIRVLVDWCPCSLPACSRHAGRPHRHSAEQHKESSSGSRSGRVANVQRPKKSPPNGALQCLLTPSTRSMRRFDRPEIVPSDWGASLPGA